MHSYIFIFCCFTVLISSANSSRRSAFGEPCSKVQLCDSRAWLGCFNETCNCLKPEEMFYDPILNTCVTKVGERCKYILENLDGSDVFKLTTCADNSLCSQDGYCSCIEDFQEFPNGTCIPTRKYHESCDVQSKCSSLFGLQCEDGRCQCENSAIFSPKQIQCVGFAGQSCIRSKCTDNSQCDAVTNKCICNEGYFQDSGSECSEKVGLLKNCTSNEQCKDGLPLKCIDGFCTCDPQISSLEEGRKIGGEFPEAFCVGKAGSPCISGRCISGGNCGIIEGTTPRVNLNVIRRRTLIRRTRNEWFGESSEDEEESIEIPTIQPQIYTHPKRELICECEPGYDVSSTRTCGKSFGSICSKNECLQPLVCRDNKCSCRYPQQVYSQLLWEKTCRNKIRGPCSANRDCIENSMCKLYTNQTYGECICQEGYIQNSKRECDVQYGEDCVKHSECDSIAGLVCIDGSCACPGFEKFSSTKRKCFGLVGGSCICNKISGSVSSGCIEGAKCSCIGTDVEGGDNEGQGTCICNDGFQVTKEYFCELNGDELMEGE